MQQIAIDTLIKVYRRTSSAHGKGPHAHCGHIKKSYILDGIIYLRPLMKKGSTGHRVHLYRDASKVKKKKKKKSLSS